MKKYRGQSLLKKVRFVPKYENGQPLKDRFGNAFPEEEILPYLSNPEIEEVVSLMQILHRPLLIKGAPGSGKTRLAKAVAYEFYGDQYRNHYFEWNIKSTSKAKDGLYAFDHIDRLRDAQLGKFMAKEKSATKKPNNRKYLEIKPLGKAIQKSTREQPSVVLIDEIDKADIDFPNDLLLELDQLRFEIDELGGEQVVAQYPPLIFITSNNEKELPPAFLRRCLFYHIDPPGENQLTRIADAHFPSLAQAITQKAVKRFYALREQMDADVMVKHKPSTSEMVDWLKILNYQFLQEIVQRLGIPEDQQKELFRELLQEPLPEKTQAAYRQAIDEAIPELLKKLDDQDIKHHQALIKNLNDLKRYASANR